MLLLLFSLALFLPGFVHSSLLGRATETLETNGLIHPKAVHVSMSNTKYWEFNPRKEHLNGMKVDVIDGPIQGCPSQDFNVPCQVGGQSFNCQVDTGSSTLGIATTACTACGGVKSFYNPTTSGATQLSTNDMTSYFGDGSGWTGNAYRDTVGVDNSATASMVLVGITSENKFFPAYDTCNFQTNPLKYSAIMGFGGSGIAVNNKNGVSSQPWFPAYAAASGTPAIFTLRMCLDTGDLWIGGYNNATYLDQLHWVNILQLGQFAPGQGYYTVAVECMGIIGGGNDCNSNDFQNGVNTIVDSGTTEAIIPAAVYSNIINRLDNIPQFAQWFGSAASSFFAAGNCASPPGNTTIQAMNAVLPQVTVQIGGADSGVSLLMTLNGVNFYLQQVVTGSKTYFCPGVVSNAATIGSKTVILGWSFMNQVIVAHDLSTKKIGFAPRLGCQDASQGGGAIDNMVGGDVNVKDATGALGVSATGANPGNAGSASNNSMMTTIGIVVGVIVGLLVLSCVVGGVYYYQKKKLQDKQMGAMNQQQQPQQPQTLVPVW